VADARSGESHIAKKGQMKIALEGTICAPKQAGFFSTNSQRPGSAGVGARKSFGEQQPTVLLFRPRVRLWNMTGSRQVHSHAVQQVFNIMTLNDTPVPQTRLDRRALESQRS
jgi:hypothetical protein